MSFSLIKAIKSTHRHPINRILHCVGASIYITGIVLILGSLVGLYTNSINGVILWSIAIGLFLIGHKIEGNLRVYDINCRLFRYIVRSGKLTISRSHEYN